MSKEGLLSFLWPMKISKFCLHVFQFKKKKKKRTEPSANLGRESSLKLLKTQQAKQKIFLLFDKNFSFLVQLNVCTKWRQKTITIPNEWEHIHPKNQETNLISAAYDLGLFSPHLKV